MKLITDTKELKKLLKQQECHKTIGFNEKNSLPIGYNTA